MTSWRWLAGGWAAGVLTAVGLNLAAEPNADTLYQKLQVFSEVLSHIENFYVDSISAEQLVYGANRGAVSVLDPHSTFFSPSEYQGLINATEGEYAGIGIELEMLEETAEIIAVLDDSPAAAAGILRGDQVLAIDGAPVAHKSFDDIHGQLTGPVGTKVVLTVLRAGRERPWTFTLVRSWIRVPPLVHRHLGDGIHYVHVRNFPRRLAADLDDLLSRRKPAGLVLDLRNNPGGLFDEAVETCDLFLRGGPIVTATGKQGREVEQHNARERAPHAHVPLAVLIDRGSASAAEVVAGALKDRRRARLFGERSYGKGSVQSILDLSDGSGLKLTIARYVTPSGAPIDGEGIKPHVHTDAPSEEGDEDDALTQATSWLRTQMSR